MQISDDDLYEVDTTPPTPITEVELFSIHGYMHATVKIPPQLVWPTCILLGNQCFIRRDDGKYYAAFTVVAEQT